MPSYEKLSPIARPMLAELRDMGAQDLERLRDMLMFDETDCEAALAELTRAGLVGRQGDVVSITSTGAGVIDRERGQC
jgi:predicted transcriptional regulator